MLKNLGAWKRVSFVLVVLALAVTIGGCGKMREKVKDAPMNDQLDNTGVATRVVMPDGYSNVATKCDHGNRIYVAFHGDSPYTAIAIVPGDPTCPKN